MLNHPDLTIQQAKIHRDDLLAEAARYRLRKLAREGRHERRSATR
jgi:hypothetical protein